MLKRGDLVIARGQDWLRFGALHLSSLPCGDLREDLLEPTVLNARQIFAKPYRCAGLGS